MYGFAKNEQGATGQIFNGTSVTKDAGKWNYNTPQYWVPGNTYTFAAIAPIGKGEVTSSSLGDEKINMVVRFENDEEGKTDLLYAAPEKIEVKDKNYSDPVQLTFKHILSLVKFTFRNNLGANYDIRVKNIHITNAKKTGNFVVTEDAETWDSQDGSFELHFGNATNNDGTTEATRIENQKSADSYNERLLIPTGDAYSVVFTIELLPNGSDLVLRSYDRTVSITNVPLKAGYRYNFTATIDKDNVNPDSPLKPIEFSVSTIEGWQQENEAENVTIPTTPQAGN